MNTIQPPINLYLRSDEASSIVNNAYIFELRNGIIPIRGLRTRLELTDFECPISFYLFHNKNNTISFNVTGDVTGLIAIQKQFTIKNFNLTELKNELNNMFSNEPHFSFTASSQSQTNKIIFTFGAKGSNTSISSVNLAGSTTCNKIIGFDKSEVSVTNNNNQVLTGNLSYNFNRTLNVYVKSPTFLTGNMDSFGKHTSTLHKYQVDQAYGSIIHYQPAIDEKYVLSNENIQNIELFLQDDDDVDLDFNGLPFHITLRFDFVKQEEYVPPDSLLAHLDKKNIQISETP